VENFVESIKELPADLEVNVVGSTGLPLSGVGHKLLDHVGVRGPTQQIRNPSLATGTVNETR